MWRSGNVTVVKHRTSVCRVPCSCSLYCRDMRRVLSHGKKIRVLIVLITVCSGLMLTFEGNALWSSEPGTRFPSYTPPEAISLESTDFNNAALEKPHPKRKSKLGRVLSSLGRDRGSPKFQKQKSLLCGTDWQEEYKKLHDDILNKRRPPKYLVYFCGGRKYGCGGYGNRLGAISSLLYLAVVTGRAFLIDWNTTTPIGSYMRPKNIRWNFPASELRGLKSNHHYWGKGEHELVNRDSQRSSDRFSVFREWIEGTDLDSFLDAPVEVITSLWYFAPSLRQHKFAERISNKFGVKPRGQRYSLVGCAFDFLFEWTPEFESTLSSARSSLRFQPNVPKIGIHIRMGDGSFFQRSLDQRTLDFKSFFTCAKKLESSIARTNTHVNLTNVKWFLATDNLDVKQYALTTFPDKVVSLTVKVEHINFRDPSTEGMTGVLLDHTLLSECDFLVLSDSSFSKTALGKNFHSLEHSTFGEKCKYVT